MPNKSQNPIFHKILFRLQGIKSGVVIYVKTDLKPQDTNLINATELSLVWSIYQLIEFNILKLKESKR